MAGQLTDADMDQLEQWIGTGPKVFNLLYSITRDGCDPATFHQKCNNQGATVTVLHNPQGSVYGAYTSKNWSSCGNHVNDDKAFLYQLYFSKTKTPRRFAVTSPGNAVYDTSSYGPSFGGGNDLRTFSQATTPTGGVYKLVGGQMNPQLYNFQVVTTANINNGTMDVTELEVYKITDGQRKRTPVQPTPVKPWRDTPELDNKFLEQLKEDIGAMKPMVGTGVSQYRILMLGPVGSGKSSFINTINSIFRGRISQQAICGVSKHSVTTMYKAYQIKQGRGSTLNMRLCDTRGLEETMGLDIAECNYLLGGHVPDLYTFNPSRQISLESPEFVLKPKPKDKVHCLVLVVDASVELPSEIADKMKGVKEKANQREIPTALLLTKLDTVDESLEGNEGDMFKSVKIKEKVEEYSLLFGLPRNNIWPIKNYDCEVQLNVQVSALALLALRHMLYMTEDYLDNAMPDDGAAHGDTAEVRCIGQVDGRVCESDTVEN